MKECCKAYLDDQFGGDADVIGEIYAEYVASVRAKKAEAEDALAAADWARLDKAAHTVKGNALSAGDNEMADTAIELRKAAVLGDAALAESLIGKIGELANLL